MDLNPYLNFDGRCAEAFDVYARTLGGKVTFSQTYGDSPAKEFTSPEWHGKIMHATLQVGGVQLMGSDAPPDRYQRPQGLYVSINVTSVDEGRRIFSALSDGGTVTMPFEPTFWAAGFGMVTDRFGTPWMVNVNQPA
jgi:PhnB protein